MEWCFFYCIPGTCAHQVSYGEAFFVAVAVVAGQHPLVLACTVSSDHCGRGGVPPTTSLHPTCSANYQLATHFGKNIQR